MDDIFISYRRDDARADAGRLHDRLVQHFGHERVFMDVDDIEPGVDFAERLQTTLESCAAVVVVIGERWLARDEQGQSRLDDPLDFVRIEVAAALKREIKVLPVLVGGATMPSAGSVPADLQTLLKRQAIEVRHSRFNDDVEQLIEALSISLSGTKPGVSRRTVIALIATGVVTTAGLFYWGLHKADVIRLRTEPAQVSTDAMRAMLVRLNFYDARQNPGGSGLDLQPEQSVMGEDVVIVEPRTGLMWQNSRFSQPKTQAKARAAVRQANESGFAGFKDWRLPTLEEAMSLMTPNKNAKYHVAPAFGANSAPFIWTADRAGNESGWVIYYYDGFAVPESVEFNAPVRAVRTVKR